MDSQRMPGEYDEQKEQLNKLISRRNNLRTAGISCGTASCVSAVVAVINFVANSSPVIQGVFATLFILFGLTAVWCFYEYVKLKDYKEREEVKLKKLREEQDVKIKELQETQDLETRKLREKQDLEIKGLREKQELELNKLRIEQELRLAEKNDNENQAHKRNMELLEYELRVKEAEYNYQLKAELIKTAQKRPEVASEIVEVISQRISQPEYIVSDEYTKYLEGTTNGQVNIDNERNAEIIQMPTKGRKE